MKFLVLATPPKTGIYKDLQPRYQMYNTGETVFFFSREEVKKQVNDCMSDRNGWTYTVEEINDD